MNQSRLIKTIFFYLLFAGLSSQLFAQQHWYNFYTNALDAVGRTDWDESLSELENALNRKQTPQFRAETYAMQEINYLPFYWLGVVYYNKGDFEKARENFDKSLQWGAVKKTDQLTVLENYRGNLARMGDLEEDFAAARRTLENLQQSANERSESTEASAPKWQEIRTAINRNELERASLLFQELRQASPNDPSLVAMDNLLQRLNATRKEIDDIRTSGEVVRMFEQGLSAFLNGDYQNAYLQFQSVRRRAPDFRDVNGWLRRTQSEITAAGIQLPESLPPDTVIQTVAPVIALPPLPAAVSDDSILISASVRDDQGIDFIEFTINGEVYKDSSGNVIRKIPPDSLDSRQFSFRESLPLVTGKNRIVIIAYDIDAVRHSDAYPIDITRKPPFYKTPLFFYSLGFLLLAAFLAVGLNIHTKRKIAFVNRYNPYIAGAPVRNPKMFYGREILLRKIINTLHNNSLMIFGPRRIGKTSMLHQLKRRLEKEKDREYFYVPVYIDLQGTPEEKFFGVMMHDIIEGCEAYFNDDLALRIKEKPQESYGPRDFSADIKRILEHLNILNDRTLRLVLLIDEVDELNAYSERANQRLRSIFMKTFAENLVAVMSGSYIKKQWESEGSPWYNFFEQVEVGGIDREIAEALVREPVSGIYSYDEDAIAEIVDYSQCVPYRIQKLCVNIISNVIHERRRHITREDVEKAKQAMPESEEI